MACENNSAAPVDNCVEEDAKFHFSSQPSLEDMYGHFVLKFLNI